MPSTQPPTFVGDAKPGCGPAAHPGADFLKKWLKDLGDMLQRDPTDKVQDMNVVNCAFGHEGGAAFLGLLISERVYRINGQAKPHRLRADLTLAHVRRSRLCRAADSAQQVDDLM